MWHIYNIHKHLHGKNQNSMTFACICIKKINTKCWEVWMKINNTETHYKIDYTLK